MSMNGAVRGHESQRWNYVHRISTDHPVLLPKRSTRLRVRWGMAFLYIATLVLTWLLVIGWEFAAFLLPFVVLAIWEHRFPLARRYRGLW